MFWPIIIGNVLAYLWCAYQVLGATYYMASMAWPNQDPPATDVILHVNVPCAGGSPAYLEIDKLPDGIYRASVGTLFEHQEVCRTRDPGGAGAARQHDGRPRKLTLGSYPAIGLATARDLAREALERVARGEDPAATKGKVGGKSFRTAVAAYIERYARVHQKTSRETERMLRVEAVSFWGDRPLAEITRDDINQRLYAILDRGSPSTSNHCFADLRRFFNWCVDEGYLEHSPCERVRRKAPQTPRDRTLTDDEIRICWSAWERQGWPGGEFQKLLLVLGQRRTEVAAARWDEFDLSERLWVIPRDRMKSGRAHAVPLSGMAMEIIGRLSRTGAFLFPGRRSGVEGPIGNFGGIKHKADELIREGGHELARWTLHDLRRSCRSNLSRLRVPSEVAEAVLAHVSPGVVGTYDRHSYLDEKREALERWAGLLWEILDPSRKVVALRRR